MRPKIHSGGEVVANIKDSLDNMMFKHFVPTMMEVSDEVVETLSNNKYDYIQFNNASHSYKDAKLIATVALAEADRQIDREVYLFISDDVIGYSTNPIQYRQQKIDGGYELIELSDAVAMLNKGDQV